jgi:hypothetical protein
MYPTVRFETNDLTIIKNKMEAYRCLFDTVPVLWIGGYFEDKHGEMIHFRSTERAIEVYRKWMLADVDGKIEYIKPTDAYFLIGG